MAESLRIAIEVVAGLIPGKDPLPEYTKRWVISSDVYYVQGKYAGKEKECQDIMQAAYGHAMEYARGLWNPSQINWVRMDWIYF